MCGILMGAGTLTPTLFKGELYLQYFCFASVFIFY